MKKLTLLLILTSIGLTVSSQTWKYKEVGNDLYVLFPKKPTYTVNKQSAIYSLKTKNCLYIVSVQFNAIPKYAEFKQLPINEQVTFINIFLDKFIEGKLGLTNNRDAISQPIKVGDYLGRKVSYSAINIATGERGKRYSKTIVMNDKIFGFECFILNDNSKAFQEEEKFLSSIKTNTSSKLPAFSQMLKDTADPNRAKMSDSFVEDLQKHNYSQVKTIDASKYRPYIKNLDLDDPNLEEKYQQKRSVELIKIIAIASISLIVILCLIYLNWKKYNKRKSAK